MRLSSRVILVTSIVLAVIIVVLVIVTRLHLPWLWTTEKWPDFWIALVSGVITLATIGALATFLVERILKDIEEQRSEKQFQYECKKEWAEFEQRLYYRFYEEFAFSEDIDYADMAIPRYAVVLAKLLETAPLSRWQQGLKFPPLLFSKLESFASAYYFPFKYCANTLLWELKSKIDEYNKNLANSGHALDTAVSEGAQLTFCLGIILGDRKDFPSLIADKQIGSLGFEIEKELRERDGRINSVAEAMLWHLRLPKTALPVWLKLFNFVIEKVGDDSISNYIMFRDDLAEYSEKIKDMIFKNESRKRRDQAVKEAEEILTRIKKGETFAPVIVDSYRARLVVFRDKSLPTEDLVHLDELINMLDQYI